MRAWKLAVALSSPLLAVVVACSGKSSGNLDPGQGGNSDDSGSPSSGSSESFSDDSSTTFFNDGSMVILPPNNDEGACKGGHYGGSFGGVYSSHITVFGIGIPVTGNVELQLNQVGSSNQTCTLTGETNITCNNVFSLQDGVIQGTADGLFPYFCFMSGTLDCVKKVLVDGWIQCTYCLGPLADGGLACDLGNGVGGSTGVGGHFAGPLTAQYNTATDSFVNGTWNGAEALAGNDGGSPTPEGGPITNYLNDAGYGGPGEFGGLGTWNATFGSDK
jgi:hypothetical protein